MKNRKLKGLLFLSLMVAMFSFGQELKHQELKSKLYAAIEANLPVRFNSNRWFIGIFYNRCDEYPKHCDKLTFDSIADFRIINISKIDSTKTNGIEVVPYKYIKINASLDFTYSAENINHHSIVKLECAINDILGGHEIEYIKVLGIKYINEFYRPLDKNKAYYILNSLDFIKPKTWQYTEEGGHEYK